MCEAILDLGKLVLVLNLGSLERMGEKTRIWLEGNPDYTSARKWSVDRIGSVCAIFENNVVMVRFGNGATVVYHPGEICLV